jgi:Circularly permutated YpsA SLOG family
MAERVISGGQTGADEAGLAVAKKLGIPTGSTMPKGWLTEAGPRPDLATAYGLMEAATANYPERPKLKVLASDGTVVFGDSRSRGSMLTARPCQRHGRPCCMIPLGKDTGAAVDRLRSWLAEHRIRTLNVAGNRASRAPGIEGSWRQSWNERWSTWLGIASRPGKLGRRRLSRRTPDPADGRGVRLRASPGP